MIAKPKTRAADTMTSPYQFAVGFTCCPADQITYSMMQDFGDNLTDTGIPPR
jgi:hypothetical protein